MSDERGKIDIGGDEPDNFDTGDVIDVTGSVVDDAAGSVDDIIASVKSDDPVPDVVKSLDDALKIIDNSDLPPSPVSRSASPLSERAPAARAGRVDKYGLPVSPPRSKKTQGEALAVQEQAQLTPLDLTEKVYTPKAGTAIAVTETAGAKIYNAAKKEFPGKKELHGKKEPEVEMPDFSEPEVDTGPPDFKIKFDFESAYRDPPENRPLRRRRERRTGLVGGLMYALFTLCIGLVLGSAIWMATVDVLGFGASDEQVSVQVPADFTMDDITDILFDAGLIRYRALFNVFAEYSNAEEKIAPGSYILNRNYDYRALVQGMTRRTGVRVETTVVIPEGYTMAQIFILLENEGVCPAEELWDAATHHDFNFYFLEKETLGNRQRLEGFLFPDTYNFYMDSTAVQAITRMLRGFDNRFSEQYKDRADFLGYTVREIITVASMIEREAGSDEERPRIAAVIYNRLDNPSSFPRLEIDATINYYRAELGISFATAMAMDNEYNTYMYPGLPPGPIANPGLASIRAALYPMSTNEYFYALNKNGTHNFFRNAADHINFVNSDEYGG